MYDVIMFNCTLLQLLIASFVTHGLLDFYTFQNVTDLSLYLLIIVVYLYGMYILPSLCTLLFVVLSMYHFGNDFVFFKASRWCGAVIFSSSVMGHYNSWYDGLTMLNVQYPQVFITAMGLSLVPSLLNCYRTPYGGLLAFIVGLGGPTNIFLYSCLFHAPLAVYRFHKWAGYVVWCAATSVVFFILPYVKIYDWMIKVSVGIVMSHIVAISYWQKTHKCAVTNIHKT